MEILTAAMTLLLTQGREEAALPGAESPPAAGWMSCRAGEDHHMEGCR